MNQKTFDDLLQKSRNQASAVLFSGELQGNTDTYLKAQPQLASQDEVPPPPKPLFCEPGASVELDNRMNMLLQPQVPRDPELEALNSYFNQRRVDEFARGQAHHIVGEAVQKQAEIAASQFMRDEMDRRAGIRRQVLDMTGLTPAQIDQQMVAESFAGINPRTMDMRERQVQDAVARFYSIQNIPAPVTEQTTNPIPATTPTGVVAGEAPRMEGEPMPELEADEEMEVSPEMPSGIDRMTTADLVKFIIANRVIADETTNSRTRDLLSKNSLKQKGKAILRRVVEEYFIRRSSAGGGGGGGVGNPAL
jgi:hypothetical protein